MSGTCNGGKSEYATKTHEHYETNRQHDEQKERKNNKEKRATLHILKTLIGPLNNKQNTTKDKGREEIEIDSKRMFTANSYSKSHAKQVDRKTKDHTRANKAMRRGKQKRTHVAEIHPLSKTASFDAYLALSGDIPPLSVDACPLDRARVAVLQRALPAGSDAVLSLGPAASGACDRLSEVGSIVNSGTYSQS